jgi:L-ascorbate metabolism protein UlaG (beta-lactamase superfamily)
MSKLKTTLISNAGILLQYKDINILVDAIYENEGHPFSKIPQDTWKKMLAGDEPFQKIDYLLFTHNHPDHFSESRLIEFLKARKVKGLFLPKDAAREHELTAFLKEHRIPAVILTKKTDRTIFRLEDHLVLRARKMRHLDKEYRNVPNFCYLLQFDQLKVLITADVDYTYHKFRELARGVDVTFVNPLFFGELGYRRFYHGELHSRAFGVYHVPFEKDDSMKMRRLLKRRMERWDPENGDVKAFSEPMQAEEFE